MSADVDDARTSGVAVLDEQRHAREGLRARVAVVLLHVRVRLQVRAQIRPVGERASAVRTLERLLAGVRAQVALQQPGPRERLAAQFTLARQRVRADVHLERAERRVSLGAVFARELASHLAGAVELAMLRQSVDGRVALVARVALEAGRAGGRAGGRASGRTGGRTGGRARGRADPTARQPAVVVRADQVVLGRLGGRAMLARGDGQAGEVERAVGVPHPRSADHRPPEQQPAERVVVGGAGVLGGRREGDEGRREGEADGGGDGRAERRVEEPRQAGRPRPIGAPLVAVTPVTRRVTPVTSRATPVSRRVTPVTRRVTPGTVGAR